MKVRGFFSQDISCDMWRHDANGLLPTLKCVMSFVDDLLLVMFSKNEYVCTLYSHAFVPEGVDIRILNAHILPVTIAI